MRRALQFLPGLLMLIAAAHGAPALNADGLLDPDKAFQFSARALDASTIEVRLSSTVSRRAFGIVISVSTSRASSSTPSSAWALRRAPSNENGLVTMPTHSAPTSRAIWATTGAAPVPVPPPAPAVTNTMSEPFRSPFSW